MANVRTWVQRDTGKYTNRITVRIEHHLCLEELINGLCSAYCRNHVEEDDGPLPNRLSQEKILESVRDEYAAWGTNAVWAWADRNPDEEAHHAWARDIIVAAFPEMAKNQ